jgi:hypothetical protein
MSRHIRHFAICVAVLACSTSAAPAQNTPATSKTAQLEFVSTSHDPTTQQQRYCLPSGHLTKVTNVSFTTGGTSPAVTATPDLQANCINVSATFQAGQVCTQIPEITYQGVFNLPTTDLKQRCIVTPSKLTVTLNFEFTN